MLTGEGKRGNLIRGEEIRRKPLLRRRRGEKGFGLRREGEGVPSSVKKGKQGWCNGAEVDKRTAQKRAEEGGSGLES